MACALLALPVVISSAQAPATAPPQTSVPQARHLTLKEALDLATRQNLDLAAARLQRAVTAAGVQIAGQRPNPSTALSISKDTPHESVSIGQAFDISGKRGQRIEVARAESGLTDLEIAELERLVRRQVRDAYYGAALARGVTAQKEKALELAKRVQGIAQARFDAGEIPQLEVFQAALEVSRAEADWKVSQQEEKVAFSRFNALVNEPAEASWDLMGEFESLPLGEALSDLISRAGAVNPALLHLAQESKVEQSRQLLLRAERVPDLHLDFGLDLHSPGAYRVAPRGQVSVDLPIFSRNQGEIARSLATQRALEGNVAAKRRGIAGAVEAAYYELEARRSEVQLYRDTLLDAGRRLEGLAQESYSAGKSPIMTVLDAQRNAQQLERDYLASVFGLHAAFAQLEESVGVPLD
jgi:cobalt-zinc-cadmium efflux system outer membrane protein